MGKKKQKYHLYYEIGFTSLLILNVILLLYLIYMVNKTRSLSQETQAQTQYLLQQLESVSTTNQP